MSGGHRQDPNLSPYVREVAIGPERINSDFKLLLYGMSPEGEAEWECDFELVWRALVEEQAQYEASNEDIPSLKKSLAAFDKLQKVRIDT